MKKSWKKHCKSYTDKLDLALYSVSQKAQQFISCSLPLTMEAITPNTSFIGHLCNHNNFSELQAVTSTHTRIYKKRVQAIA